MPLWQFTFHFLTLSLWNTAVLDAQRCDSDSLHIQIHIFLKKKKEQVGLGGGKKLVS